MRRRRVAVTGLGVVAPNGIGKKPFWDNLIAGRSAVNYLTAFDPSPYPSKVAAEVKDFHPLEFMRRQTANTAGRAAQFAVASTRMALNDAELPNPRRFSSEIAICHGTSGGADIFEQAARDFLAQGIKRLSRWAALEYPPHAPASSISIEMGIVGPALSVSSNCCTGLDVIRVAASTVASGRARFVIAGSSEAPIFPVTFATFCALGSLTTRTCAPHQASRPYDRLRDGLVVSEGAATLVLEDFESAIARGVYIYAEVLGSASASESVGMRKADLEGRTMSHVISRALIDSKLLPANIDHVNAHGSSLPDFDVCDSRALKLALGTHVYNVPITSIKSMIGQPFAAAGTLQAAAACLTLTSRVLPPTINQEMRDPLCDLDYVPNTARSGRVNTVLINGHSFGGSVSAIILGSPRI